jgi:4-hydroxythreonine-4-phosphate dehydrogenase
MIRGAPIALTMGDPSGIGPELSARLWQQRDQTTPPFMMIADPALMARFVPVKVVTSAAMARHHFANALPVMAEPLAVEAVPGQPAAENGTAILNSIRRATALALTGEVRAIVTNPIHKAGLYATGFEFPGHTEFLAHLTDSTRAVMMLAIPGLRVVPATIHIPIRDVTGALSTDLLVDTGRILASSLIRYFGIARPRIVVAGLNPHAGESGTIGTEDRDIVAPAIAALQAMGIDIIGPAPADSLFHADARQLYDAVICQYHDQALIPIKTLDFFGGVNVTLGLPIIRTSPDHGTAYDIAGQMIANGSSLFAALMMAHDMALCRSGPVRR